MNQTFLICYIFLIGSLWVTANKGKVFKLQKLPLPTSLQKNVSSVELKLPTEANFLVIKPYEDNADESRFFRGILLLRNLLGLQSNRPGDRVPYLIINYPTNLTNINHNILSNVPAAGIPTDVGIGTGTGTDTDTGTGTGTLATTGTGMETGIGTGTGTGIRGTATGGAGDTGTADGGRVPYPALTYSVPMPLKKPIYQQSQRIVPQIIYTIPLNRIKQNKRGRYNFKKSNKTKKISQNPSNNNNSSSPFAGNISKVQYL